MAGGYIFFNFMLDVSFTREALMPLFLALLEREGGPRKRWEGYLCFFIRSCCGYNGEVVAFSPLYLIPLSLVLRSCRAGTSFGSVEHQRKQNALWGFGHGSSFLKYTYSPPTSTSLGSAQQSSFTRQSDVRNILLFRQVIPALRPLIPQRVRSCLMYCLT